MHPLFVVGQLNALLVLLELRVLHVGFLEDEREEECHQEHLRDDDVMLGLYHVAVSRSISFEVFSRLDGLREEDGGDERNDH